MKTQTSFCIVGAGMSGLLMAIRLKQAGFTALRVLEKAPDLGGTWYYNRYPGVACDVPAPYYAYSFALNSEWSQKFAPGKEIHQYFKNVAKRFHVDQLIEYNTEVLAAKFDGKCWHVTTNTGEQFSVDFLISACGILHKAVFPKNLSLENFQGEMFHSSEWHEDYDWHNKRIAVIGNGSTGVQMLPRLAEKAQLVVSFQRSAQWIMPAKNKLYSENFKRALRFIPGFKQWQYWTNRLSFESFTRLVLEDGWQRKVVHKVTQGMLNTVRDKELKKKLTPDYAPGCKRLVMSNEYYRAMQKNNVELCVDEIECLTKTGVRTIKGNEYAFDLIILATGFDARAYMRPMLLENEYAQSLEKIWQAEGIQAYRTVMLPDFSNFFMVLGPNSPVGNFSVIAAAENQTNFILKVIHKKISKQVDAVSVSKQATQAYNQQIKQAMQTTIWLTGCRSWYLDEQGNSATWPWTPQKFRADLKRVAFNDLIFSNKNN